jgi:hypothetical protein
LLHGAPTLSPFTKFNNVFNNLLLFAARPTLAIFFTLFLFRDEDTKLTCSLSDDCNAEV